MFSEIQLYRHITTRPWILEIRSWSFSELLGRPCSSYYIVISATRHIHNTAIGTWSIRKNVGFWHSNRWNDLRAALQLDPDGLESEWWTRGSAQTYLSQSKSYPAKLTTNLVRVLVFGSFWPLVSDKWFLDSLSKLPYTNPSAPCGPPCRALCFCSLFATKSSTSTSRTQLLVTEATRWSLECGMSWSFLHKSHLLLDTRKNRICHIKSITFV